MKKLKESPFTHLANFFCKLMLIPHSNMFVESMFSHINNIKNEKRNLLDITTMSSIMKIKSYYDDNDEVFEPNEEHYESYRIFIKS